MVLKRPLEGQLFIVRAETRRQHTVLFNLSWELAHRATQNVHSSVHVHDHESTVRKWIHQHWNLQIIWITHSSTNGNDSHHNFHKLIPKNVSEVLLWLKSIPDISFPDTIQSYKKKAYYFCSHNKLSWLSLTSWVGHLILSAVYLSSLPLLHPVFLESTTEFHSIQVQ